MPLSLVFSRVLPDLELICLSLQFSHLRNEGYNNWVLIFFWCLLINYEMLVKCLRQPEKYLVYSMPGWWAYVEFTAQCQKEKLISIPCQFCACYLTKSHYWWSEWCVKNDLTQCLQIFVHSFLASPLYCVRFKIKKLTSFSSSDCLQAHLRLLKLRWSSLLLVFG